MTGTLHLEEVCVSNSKSMPACATASQCVEAVTPETDTRSKHIPSITLLAVKRQMRSAVLMEQVYEKSNTAALLHDFSILCLF